MPIPVTCPSCGAKGRAPDNRAGRKTVCPKCGYALIVPNSMVRGTHTASVERLPDEITEGPSSAIRTPHLQANTPSRHPTASAGLPGTVSRMGSLLARRFRALPGWVRVGTGVFGSLCALWLMLKWKSIVNLVGLAVYWLAVAMGTIVVMGLLSIGAIALYRVLRRSGATERRNAAAREEPSRSTGAKPPTSKQIAYLKDLGYEGLHPTSSWQASVAIDAMLASKDSKSAERAILRKQKEERGRHEGFRKQQLQSVKNEIRFMIRQNKECGEGTLFLGFRFSALDDEQPSPDDAPYVGAFVPLEVAAQYPEILLRESLDCEEVLGEDTPPEGTKVVVAPGRFERLKSRTGCLMVLPLLISFPFLAVVLVAVGIRLLAR